VLGGDDTMWSCSLGRRSHRDRLDSSVSGDQRPRDSGVNTGSGRVLSPRYFDPSDHCDTAKHAHMHSVRSSLIRDDLERMQQEQRGMSILITKSELAAADGGQLPAVVSMPLTR
jgi:hypothetical protein